MNHFEENNIIIDKKYILDNIEIINKTIKTIKVEYCKEEDSIKINEEFSEYNPEPEELKIQKEYVLTHLKENNIDALIFYEDGDYLFSFYLLKKFEFLINKFESLFSINLEKFKIINKYNLVIISNKLQLYSESIIKYKETINLYKDYIKKIVLFYYLY